MMELLSPFNILIVVFKFCLYMYSMIKDTYSILSAKATLLTGLFHQKA